VTEKPKWYRVPPIELKPGQIWEGLQNPGRYLIIDKIGEQFVSTSQCWPRGGRIQGARAVRPIRIDRIRPIHNGYRLVKDVTP